jgi:hypothetical protein
VVIERPEDVPAHVREQIIKEELARRSRENRARRMQQKARTHPDTGKWVAVQSGRHKRLQRPPGPSGLTHVDDRQYVPGVLRHFRRVHGLSQIQAQVRIGYSATSSSWRNWESGFVVPPYRVLLAIIASTGLGYLEQTSDPRGVADVEGNRLLEATKSADDRDRRRRAA